MIRFREVNRDIFQAIVDDRKKVETRAATPKYTHIKAGDSIMLICGKEKTVKHIKKATHFQTIEDILKNYTPEEINPNVSTAEEIRSMWYSFPGYEQKINQYGLVAWELE